MAIEYKKNGDVSFNDGLDQMSARFTVEQKIIIKAIENDYECRLQTAYRRGSNDKRDEMRKRLGEIAKSL